MYVDHRPLVIGEVARIEHLEPRIVLSVERSNGGRASRVLGILRIVEPQPQMVLLDRVEGRVETGVRKRATEHDRSRSAAWSDTERLNAEPADEMLGAL